MIAKILFRGFNFLCGSLVFILMGLFASAYIGLVIDPKEGDIDLGGKDWSEFLSDSTTRGWKYIANGFKS